MWSRQQLYLLVAWLAMVAIGFGYGVLVEGFGPPAALLFAVSTMTTAGLVETAPLRRRLAQAPELPA